MNKEKEQFRQHGFSPCIFSGNCTVCKRYITGTDFAYIRHAKVFCKSCADLFVKTFSTTTKEEDKTKSADMVNHPPHYTSHPSGIECIQITEHMGFNMGNALKYVWRADLKHDAVKDMEKAVWYINREITKRKMVTP